MVAILYRFKSCYPHQKEGIPSGSPFFLRCGQGLGPQAEEWPDFGGHRFSFLIRQSKYEHLSVREVFAESLTGDAVNDAVYRRNALLQESCNCDDSCEMLELAMAHRVFEPALLYSLGNLDRAFRNPFDNTFLPAPSYDEAKKDYLDTLPEAQKALQEALDAIRDP